MSATSKAATQAGAITAHVSIVNVRLVEAKARTMIRRPSEVDDEAEIHVEHKAQLTEMPDQHSLFFVRAGVRLSIAAKAQPSRPVVIVAAFFELTYLLQPGVQAMEAELEAFARTNGVFNAWPYFREFVHSTMLRMGLPPVTLPLYRVTPAQSSTQERTTPEQPARRKSKKGAAR